MSDSQRFRDATIEAPDGLGDFHKVAGTHCATCFKLLNHKDHKAFGDQCSDCHSTAKMERIGHAVAVGFGFLVRWTFFIASGFAVWAYCAAGDWTAFNTRFADLTISRLFETTVRSALVALVSGGLFWWAFRQGEKNYRAWALIGACAIAALIYMYRR